MFATDFELAKVYHITLTPDSKSNQYLFLTTSYGVQSIFGRFLAGTEATIINYYVSGMNNVYGPVNSLMSNNTKGLSYLCVSGVELAKEVPLNDLPLFINMPYKLEEYLSLLKGETRVMDDALRWKALWET